MNIQIKFLPYDSLLQKESIVLRDQILREPLGLEYTKEELANEFDQFHIGAICQGKVIGILLLVHQSDQELKMRQFAVDTACQKQGIGKKLVLFAEKWAIQGNYPIITLHAREEAVNFYHKLGYSIIGEVFTEVSIPHRKMRKDL